MSVWGSCPLLLRSHPPAGAQPLHLLQDHTHPSWPWELVLTLPASRGPPAAPSTPPRSLFHTLKRHLSHSLTGHCWETGRVAVITQFYQWATPRVREALGPQGPQVTGGQANTRGCPQTLYPQQIVWCLCGGYGGTQPLLGQGEGLLVALGVPSTPPQDGERGSWWQRWGTGHRTGNPMSCQSPDLLQNFPVPTHIKCRQLALCD